ncbi:MAG: flagellar filament capping protein FliD [Roseburia sp.]
MPIRITGLNSGLDTESIISALVSSYNYKTDKYKKAQTKLSWKQDAWKTLNTKIYSFYNSVGNLKLSSAYNLKSTTVSDSTKATVSASSSVPNGTQKLNVLKVAQTGYLTGGELTVAGQDVTGGTKLSDLGYMNSGNAQIKVTMGDGTEKDIDVTKDTTVNEFVAKLKEAGLSANFDEANKRIFINAKESGTAGDFKLSGDGAVLSALKIDNASAVKIQASDAEIKLNGVTYTSSQNTFSINGLSITAQGVTGDGDDKAITITTSTDTQGIYDKIKDFMTQYNSLINEITSLYNAAPTKGYEPLTDEEKDAMSDAEVEKWEEKIKASLLRRDDSLAGVMNAMTSSMRQGFEIDGKKYYLSSFGIRTQGYLSAPSNQNNAFHIDGDEDDSVSSGNEDKLMAAITSDPDTVLAFMQKLAEGLYDTVGDKMKATSLSSVYTVYNDKEMASEYSDYTSLIKKWEEKLTKQEDYYYKKFAAMETALSKINSQSSSFSGLLGG